MSKTENYSIVSQMCPGEKQKSLQIFNLQAIIVFKSSGSRT